MSFIKHKLSVLFACAFIAIFVTGCKKEKLYFGPYLKCTINGERYRDQAWGIVKPLEGSGPTLKYELKDGRGLFEFNSICNNENPKISRGYIIDFTIYIDSLLVTDKEYKFSPLSGLERIEDEKEISIYYKEQRQTFCTVYEIKNPLKILYIGTGSVQFTHINYTTHQIEGIINFEIPVANNNEANSKEILKIQGEFQCYSLFKIAMQ